MTRRIYFEVAALTLVLNLVSTGVLGQDIQAQDRVGFEASVSSDSSGLFEFVYEVTNIRAAGAISRVTIDISRSAGGLALVGKDLPNGLGFQRELSAAVLGDPSATVVLPVGLAAPTGWSTSQAVDGTAVWFGDGRASFVAVGQTARGFKIISHGIPGIRVFTARPYINVNDLPIRPPDGADDVDRYLAEVEAAKDTAGARGLTIGPVAPPQEFDAMSFLGTIVNYEEQAYSLGWIRSAESKRRMDLGFSDALAALKNDDPDTARRALADIASEIDRDAGRALSPEAVSLLRFNIDYLIKVAHLKLEPTIDWLPPPSIIYGTKLGSAQLNATSSVPGSFVYSPVAGTVLGAGSRTLSVTFTPNDSVNYAVATSAVLLQVTKRTPSITWANPGAITAGATLGPGQLNASVNAPGILTYTPPAGTLMTAGLRTLTVTFSPYDDVDYTSATATVTLSVNAMPIPGDLNGDGKIDCLDVALVNAALGKRSGQTGFDARADVNQDHLVDVRDLAFVTQKLPAGTKCP